MWGLVCHTTFFPGSYKLKQIYIFLKKISMSKAATRATINANIKTNGNQEITGQILNSVLNTMVDDYATQEQVNTLNKEINKVYVSGKLPIVVGKQWSTYVPYMGGVGSVWSNIYPSDRADTAISELHNIQPGTEISMINRGSIPYIGKAVTTDDNGVVKRLIETQDRGLTTFVTEEGETNLYVNYFLYDESQDGVSYKEPTLRTDVLQSEIDDLNLSQNSAYRGVINSWDDIEDKEEAYISSDGTIYVSEYRWLSKFIKVKPGDKVSFSLMNLNIGGGYCYGIACYDADKNFLSNRGYKGNTSYETGYIIITEDVKYIRISDVKNSNATFNIPYLGNITESYNSIFFGVEDLLKRNANSLKGKKIALFGDSIFAIAGNEGGKWNTIAKYLAQLSDAEIDNYAIGGTGLNTIHSDGIYQFLDFPALRNAIDSNNFTQQLAAAQAIGEQYVINVVNKLTSFDMEDYDIILLGYGANDYTSGVTLDNLGGMMTETIQWIYSKNPNINIAFDLPHYRLWNTPADFIDDTFTHTNYNGIKLDAYVEKMKESAKDFGIPCNENHNTMGWNYYNRYKYFPSGDGAHFNELACAICAKRLFIFLNAQGWQ